MKTAVYGSIWKLQFSLHFISVLFIWLNSTTMRYENINIKSICGDSVSVLERHVLKIFYCIGKLCFEITDFLQSLWWYFLALENERCNSLRAIFMHVQNGLKKHIWCVWIELFFLHKLLDIRILPIVDQNWRLYQIVTQIQYVLFTQNKQVCLLSL